jgi:hypothetical protein
MITLRKSYEVSTDNLIVELDYALREPALFHKRQCCWLRPTPNQGDAFTQQDWDNRLNQICFEESGCGPRTAQE